MRLFPLIGAVIKWTNAVYRIIRGGGASFITCRLVSEVTEEIGSISPVIVKLNGSRRIRVFDFAHAEN
uniref:Uncharacterized protein n=1 Tax=Candidatus Kentrum sp. FM TaxID=2126340 RepID=A0A450SEP8_9GAMM|nr:MAG: hypothetical protein BECKFM1743C_GA0114222_100954 [Candidatus Kentron sp. FM]